MQNTIIPLEDGSYKNIIDYIREELGPEYIGGPEVVNCADYGIPQTRIRLITIFTSTENGKAYFNKYGSFMPIKTHSDKGVVGTKKWVSLRDAIGTLPKLSAKEGEEHRCNSKVGFIIPLLREVYQGATCLCLR